MLVSACILARNAEQTIGRCIDSLAGLADESLVLDTGSSDTTVRIARTRGARVIEERWADDFAYHRNQLLDAARGEWVLMIDSDEQVVEPTPASKTREKLSDPTLPNILMVRHVSTYPSGSQRCETLARWVRRRCGIRYVHRVHEQLATDGADAKLSDTVLHHSGYSDELTLRRKRERNLRLAKLMPDDHPHALHTRMRELAALDRWSESVATARKLLLLPIPVQISFDAHVHSALGIINQQGTATGGLSHHVVAAAKISPDHPDVHFLQLLGRSGAFLRSVHRHETRLETGPMFRSVFSGFAPAVREFRSALSSSALPGGICK